MKLAKPDLRLFALCAVLAIPSLTSALHTPAAGHEAGLSLFVSIALLIVFGLSLPAAMQKQPGTAGANVKAHHAAAVTEHRDLWPLSFAIAMLAISGVGAAFVSEWFVYALEPFIKQLGISEAFLASSSWPLPATPSRTWSASNSRPKARPITRSVSSCSRRSRWHWCSPLCWCY